jgi:hypothetical protein
MMILNSKKVLGKGAFGKVIIINLDLIPKKNSFIILSKVLLVKKKETEKFYLRKVMDRKMIMTKP